MYQTGVHDGIQCQLQVPQVCMIGGVSGYLYVVLQIFVLEYVTTRMIACDSDQVAKAARLASTVKGLRRRYLCRMKNPSAKSTVDGAVMWLWIQRQSRPIRDNGEVNVDRGGLAQAQTPSCKRDQGTKGLIHDFHSGRHYCYNSTASLPFLTVT